MRHMLMLCLLLVLPARAGATLITLTISNPSIYTAVFLVDTTTDTVTWVSGLDAPGGSSFWTPAVPRLLSLSSTPVPIDFPDDSASLVQVFTNPDFTATGSDSFLLAYPTSAAGMMWNEGSALVSSNHAAVENGFAALRMPVSSTLSLQVTYASGASPNVLNPGWSIVAVPEPGTLLLIGGGLAALLVGRGRRA